MVLLFLLGTVNTSITNNAVLLNVSSLYGYLGGKTVLQLTSQGTAKIAGWNFINQSLTNNKIELNSDGLIRQTDNYWKLSSNGSASFANNSIKISTSGILIKNPSPAGITVTTVMSTKFDTNGDQYVCTYGGVSQ
jgi:hypothetical protein